MVLFTLLAWAGPTSPSAPTPALRSPAELLRANLSNHVLPGHDARCAPDELAKAGRPVIAPQTQTTWLSERGIDAPMISGTVDDLRNLVIGWLAQLTHAGDARIAGRTFCVGLWDDVKGANSFAAGGKWIYVGVRDLETMSKVHGAGLSATVEYTMGHEFGHALQQGEGLAFTGSTARGAELHADCVAGYLMGLDRNPQFSRISRLVASNEAFRIGDHRHADPGHHGTPAERQKAFQTGWDAGIAAAADVQRVSAGILTTCASLL